MIMKEFREERDSLGVVRVPKEATWGAQTQRSLENFPIGKEEMPEEVIRALIHIKRGAAIQNQRSEKLSSEKSKAIVEVADRLLREEDLMAHFPLKVWQTGSGTQTNMNVNEVLTYLSNKENGTISLHPNDDLNQSQSSNDVFPTAMNMATYRLVMTEVMPELENWQRALRDLENRYKKTIKIGRTHLQDATPLTFGQEISGWRVMIEKNQENLRHTLKQLSFLPIGGTAVGTGLNAPTGFSEGIVKEINGSYYEGFQEEPNKFYGLTSHSNISSLHGVLTSLAGDLMKIANDIRWLASGPRSGIGEITIPSNEPGSSIMPGKINPTQAEALTMIAVQVMGNNTTVQFASSQGNFELNVFKPVIILNVIQSIELISQGMASFRERCLEGLKVNKEKMADLLQKSLMLVTALSPHVGYEKSSEIAHYAHENNTSILEAAKLLTDLQESEIQRILEPINMIP